MIETPIEAPEEAAHFLASLDLFKKLDSPTLHDLVSSMTQVRLGGGIPLIEEGETERTLYILWHGRLRVYKNGESTAEVSVGEVVGEIALLSGEPRTATVFASRDSILLKLDYEQFQYFEQIHPDGVARIAKTAINRLVSKHHPIQPGENTVTITIAPAGNSNHRSFLHRFAEELSTVESTFVVTQEVCNQHFGREVAQVSIDHPDSLAIYNWLTSLESAYRFILYETDTELTDWTRRCLRQADSVFFIAEIKMQRRRNPIEETLYSQHRAPSTPNTVVIFVHPDEEPTLQGAHQWLETRPVTRYHHVHLGSDLDFARVIRFIRGTAFGLVLNGGGMRGFTHMGVIKALHELNIPIDYVGGCSIGAAIGGIYACVGLEESIKVCHLEELPGTSSDYTFPVVSLLKGKNVCEFYKKIYNGSFIEDLKIPFFCVSSDLTHSELHVHEKGMLWEAVRASSSIPAVYPPMYDKKERSMLVDGALMNNMPVDVMRQFLGGGRILAVDCNIEPLSENRVIKHPWLSGWKLAFQALLHRRLQFDNIFKIVRTSFMFSSEKNQEQMKSDADYLIEIESQQFGVLKMQEVDALIDLGYRCAMEQLPSQLEKAL
ncbi:MAG: putative NTE family protein [Chlamydiales bacterium]|nr:putative NTE family protein [Chlamydiales bacterium]